MKTYTIVSVGGKLVVKLWMGNQDFNLDAESLTLRIANLEEIGIDAEMEKQALKELATAIAKQKQSETQEMF